MTHKVVLISSEILACLDLKQEQSIKTEPVIQNLNMTSSSHSNLNIFSFKPKRDRSNFVLSVEFRRSKRKRLKLLKLNIKVSTAEIYTKRNWRPIQCIYWTQAKNLGQTF